MGITAASGAAAATTSQTGYTFSNSELGGEDFLRLMIEELVNQDPLSPMNNQELLTQVSQIRNMQTLSNLDTTMTDLGSAQKVATAGALIGKEVSGVSTGNANVTGVVQSVKVGSKTGVVLVTAGGDEIAIDNVTSIREVAGQ